MAVFFPSPTGAGNREAHHYPEATRPRRAVSVGGQSLPVGALPAPRSKPSLPYGDVFEGRLFVHSPCSSAGGVDLLAPGDIFQCCEGGLSDSQL